MYKKRYRVDVIRVISKRFNGKKGQVGRRCPLNKSGQVTVFIILGILLLLALILVIFVKREVVTFKPEEIIPTEKGKVENFITACIDRVGSEALFLIGLQGGYIEVPARISEDSSVHLRVSPQNVVPYWAYGRNTDVPSLAEIKFDIDRYLEEHVRDCLFEMEAFQENYDLIEKSSLAANTEIVESKVLFNLRWEIEIRDKSGEVITEVINHVAESPVKLKNVHEMASRIIEKEMETLKLEDITQDLIALEHPGVPVAGMDLSCSKRTWDVENVKSTLLDLLRVNVRELKIQGTNFVEFPEEYPYYQNHYVWNIGENVKNPQIGVKFNFDQTYPYTFGVTPLAGNKMQSSQLGGSELLSFLCIQTWKFTYDLVYPVLVTVYDDTTGYTFQMAFTVHLIRNYPSRQEAFARQSVILDKATDEDYCDVMNVPMTVRTYELIENNKGVYNRLDLGDVNLSFTCLRYSCDMGQSEFDFAGQGFSGVARNFPYCVGGILRGEKRGYKEDWERVVTTAGTETELELAPLFKFPTDKIRVVKHAAGSNVNEKIESSGQELEDDEIALIKMVYTKNDDLPDAPFHKMDVVKSAEFSPQINAASINAGEEDAILFLARADFNYRLEIDVLKDQRITGGYRMNWTVPWDQLRDAEEIVFHVLSTSSSREEEMFNLIGNLETKSVFVPEPEIR